MRDMERKIESELLTWKDGPEKKALMVKGARQVGKTFSIDEFGRRNYRHYLRIDCRDVEFEEGYWKGDASEIVNRITMDHPEFYANGRESLLFLDEIQDCPEAISALKPLASSGLLQVVCSGFLLGLYDKSPKRYPVGYVHEVEMHPLDFEEYLWAIGMSHEQTSSIGRRVRDREPFDPHVLHTLERYFRDYLIIGGMPLPVKASVESVNAGEFLKEQDDIIAGYRQDIIDYSDESIRFETLKLLNMVPAELGKPNKRLRFKDIEGKENSGIREYREPVDWIENSKLVTLCRRVTAIDRPIGKNARESMFKMYLVDTGLLVRMYGDGTREAMMRKDLSVNEGAIGENVVCQMLTARGITPYYYEVDKEVETDFVVEIGADLCTIEVKTGKKRRARSMKKLMEMESGKKVDRWIKFEYGNIMVTEDGVEHYPLFCASFADMLVNGTDFVPLKADPTLMI